MKYSQEALQEMADKVNLYEYVEDDLEFVKHSGKIHYCKCVFHNEKTASLAFYEDENRFYCFGCKASGNIITWIQKTKNISFGEAVEFVAKMTGTETKEYIECNSISVYKQLQLLNKNNPDEMVQKRQHLDFAKDYFNRFSEELPTEWIEEGIAEEELKKYEIMVDKSSNRIVYPVYDNEFQLIGIKGRTRFKNFKELKLAKYMNYYPLGGVDYFAGMKQAKKDILDSKAVIIVEGIKSVMKIDAWNYHNCVASETSVLNDNQIAVLLKMHLRDIIIAYDKDVPLDKIKKMSKDLKLFCNVYAVFDRKNLLDEKMSPCDKGKEVWDKLYHERIRI